RRRRKVQNGTRVLRPTWMEVLPGIVRHLQWRSARDQTHPNLVRATFIGDESYRLPVGGNGGCFLQPNKIGEPTKADHATARQFLRRMRPSPPKEQNCIQQNQSGEHPEQRMRQSKPAQIWLRF